MERLPDELVLLILELVPPRDLALNGARVCRRWRALLAPRVLLLAPRRRGGPPGPAPGEATRALLALAPPPAPPRDLLAAAPALRHLVLHAAAPLGPADLAALARLPHLAHLDAFLRDRVLGPRALPALRRLEALVANEPVAPGVLRALAGAAPRLRALHMYGRALHYPRRELRALLAARAPHLTELTLRCAELRDADYAALGACPALVALRLYSCLMLRAAGAAHLVRPPRLRVLHACGARMLRPRALAALLPTLPPRLDELALSGSWFGDEHRAALAARVPALRTLELWRCRATGAGLTELAAALPRLEELDVDAPLGRAELGRLEAHPTLRRLRCSRADDEDDDDPKDVETKLRVRRANARLAGRWLRGGGEGWRAELFYHWTQDLPLPELPPRRLPGDRPPPDDRTGRPGDLWDVDDDDAYFST